MPDPADRPPKPLSEFEKKLNVFQARINEVSGEVGHIEAIVEQFEDVYTSPSLSFDDRVKRYIDLFSEFNEIRHQFNQKREVAYHYLIDSIGLDPESESPEHLEKLNPYMKELQQHGFRVDALSEYILTLRPRKS